MAITLPASKYSLVNSALFIHSMSVFHIPGGFYTNLYTHTVSKFDYEIYVFIVSLLSIRNELRWTREYKHGKG